MHTPFPWRFAIPLLLSIVNSPAQQAVPSEGFESYTLGALNGQGGWTALGIAGTSEVTVNNNTAREGSKSLYVLDGDTVGRPKARRDYGSNVTNGNVSFSVRESTASSARDNWRVDFYNTGSSAVNFTVYGGASLSVSSSTATLASISETNSSYQAGSWNTVRIAFNNTSKSGALYLNGEATPALTFTDSGTNWSVGRIEFSVGWGSAIGMGVYYDSFSAPEWELTNKLKYAPPTLVAPTVVALAGGGFYSGSYASDEDVIVNLSSTQTRTSGTTLTGGRNLRIIGGDFGKNGPRLNLQTVSIFLEGVKINYALGLPVINGCPVEANTDATRQENDGIQAGGVPPGTAVAPDVFIQNCHISGVHGTQSKHLPGIALQSLSYRKATNDYSIVTSVAHGLAVGQQVICGPTAQAQLNDTYKVKSIANSTTFIATRWAAWISVTPPLTVDLTAGGGYLWAIDQSQPGNHSDAFQCLNQRVLNVVRFYRVTLESNYQAFIGGHGLNDSQARGLEMTRVNIRQNNVWPQVYASMSLYLGDVGVGQPGSGSRMGPFPVQMDRVFIKPKAGRGLLDVIFPGPNDTRTLNGVIEHIGAFSTDGGLTASWEPALDVTGAVSLSTNGFSNEPGYVGKDYADLTGANAPGLNYTSPGYSSEAVQSLTLSSIVSPSSAAIAVGAVAGTVVARLDVSFSGAGHIIDLALSDSSGGRFALSGRNLVRSSSETLAAGNYTVAVTAAQRGNTANIISKSITINAQ